MLVRRARILLLATDGVANTQIAQRVGVSRPTVIACRRRYVRRGLEGLPDQPRPGRPQTVRRLRRAEILAVTLSSPPARLGITHWSTRLLARELGVSRDSIARIWREYGIQPWRAETFTFSTDPELAANDYIRHGTTTLFAALEVATGRVINRCAARHRHQEFLGFLSRSPAPTHAGSCTLVCDNYATHKHPTVRGWLASHPRIQLHFTPTSAPWLNLVEVFFSIVERHALRRGDFTSVTDLIAAISRFCAAWNQRCQPFSWTKPADEILTKLNRQTTSATQH